MRQPNDASDSERTIARTASKHSTSDFHTVTADLDLVRRVAAADHNLAVCTTTRSDGSVHASVVSAGVIDDPVDGARGVGFVAAGNSLKLRLLRRNKKATLVFKSGFQWVAVSGSVRLVGPSDGLEFGLGVPQTIRRVFQAAGGNHEDWDEFDRVMVDEGRCAVFVRADIVSSNPTG